MANDEVVKIVTELLGKTQRREVPWIEPAFDLITTTYPLRVVLRLPKSRVEVRRHKDGAMEFLILNEDGTAVRKVTASKQEELHAPLTEILSIGINQARKVEQTIRDVEDFLKAPPQKPGAPTKP